MGPRHHKRTVQPEPTALREAQQRPREIQNLLRITSLYNLSNKVGFSGTHGNFLLKKIRASANLIF